MEEAERGWGKKRMLARTHTAPSTFLLSPHFLCGPNAKKLFRVVRFHSACTGMLAAQAKFGPVCTRLTKFVWP